MYVPTLARFTARDPVGPNAPMVLYSRSPYAYAMNQPLRFVDPSGRLTEEQAFDIFKRVIEQMGDPGSRWSYGPPADITTAEGEREWCTKKILWRGFSDDVLEAAAAETWSIMISALGGVGGQIGRAFNLIEAFKRLGQDPTQAALQALSNTTRIPIEYLEQFHARLLDTLTGECNKVTLNASIGDGEELNCQFIVCRNAAANKFDVVGGCVYECEQIGTIECCCGSQLSFPFMASGTIEDGDIETDVGSIDVLQ